jgi:hypothetical protein
MTPSKPIIAHIMGRDYQLVEAEGIDTCHECALSGFLGHCEETCVELATRHGIPPLRAMFKSIDIKSL